MAKNRVSPKGFSYPKNCRSGCPHPDVNWHKTDVLYLSKVGMKISIEQPWVLADILMSG